MSVLRRISMGLVWALVLALPAVASAQVQPAPRDPYLAVRERLEQIEQEKRNREREWERRKPKPSGCQAMGTCALGDAGIRSEAIPGTGLVAVLHDVDVEKESLTIRLRFINRGSEPATITLDPGVAYAAYFVEVEGEKRHILRADDGALAAKKPLARALPPGAMESWWAKFPPLAPGATTFDVVIPPAPRFEDVSVADD